jgi:hypothetical protein
VRVRTCLTVLAVSGLAVACGSSGSPSGSAATSEQPGGTGGGEPTETGGGGGGEASDSVVYTITGDYEASGELAFAPDASTFNDGWNASFSENGNDALIQINALASSITGVTYGDPQVVIAGTEDSGCTFDFAQNDSEGLAGTFDCPDLDAGMSQTGEQITVDFSGTFEGSP